MAFSTQHFQCETSHPVTEHLLPPHPIFHEKSKAEMHVLVLVTNFYRISFPVTFYLQWFFSSIVTYHTCISFWYFIFSNVPKCKNCKYLGNSPSCLICFLLEDRSLFLKTKQMHTTLSSFIPQPAWKADKPHKKRSIKAKSGTSGQNANTLAWVKSNKEGYISLTQLLLLEFQKEKNLSFVLNTQYTKSVHKQSLPGSVLQCYTRKKQWLMTGRERTF